MVFGQLNGQDISVKVELNKDSVGYEETISVTFTIENAKDFKFEQPDFSAFESAVHLGTQNHVSIINGQTTQSTGYTFMLRHFGKGKYSIEPATFIVDGEEYITDIINVVVTEKAVMPDKRKENPYSIFKHDEILGNPFDTPENRRTKPSEKKKKSKKKVYKI